MNDHLTKVNDCWNTIGTWGDAVPRCERLIDALHCINCDVYAAAGRRLLNRNVPQGYLEEYGKRLSAPITEKSGAVNSSIIFRIDDNWVALPTTMLESVLETSGIHSLPHSKNQVILGVVNVAGELMVCVSLQRLIGRPDLDSDNEDVRDRGFRRKIVITADHCQWVFPVDEVLGMHRFTAGDAEKSQHYSGIIDNKYVKGIVNWQQKPVIHLDEDRLARTLSGLRI